MWGKKAREIEKRIDNMFYYDHASNLRLVSDPSMVQVYERFIDRVKDLENDGQIKSIADKHAGN